MSALTVRLPDSLHRHLKRVAEADGVSVNQFISLAVAEKLSALQTYDLIAQRAARSSREDFLEAMAAVPDVPPVPGDELPEKYKGEQGVAPNA
ncbi:MAG TPA: toxin-antitoxin system HicB family antitoxin [Verrucomicrobiales bacterium]|nr:toxin-antitoxin system HicB family antitoxin [Verrucomicrobiales bacterium]